jgi:homoserine dehydrogenase
MRDGGVTAFVEPTLVARSAREASVRRNDNYLSYFARRSGAYAFVGQGAGRGPTACAVMGDLLDILSGAEKPEYVRTDAALRADNALEAHRYYVRGAEPPFARKRVGERAWLTENVPVPEMHAAMAKARQADPGVFFAGVREDAVSGN